MDSMEYIKETLPKLMAIDSPSGFTKAACDFVMDELKSMGFMPHKTHKGGVLCCFGGETIGNPVIFSAHIDTLGGMVSEIKSNGRLKLTRIGGIQPNNIETENCRIYTRFDKVFSGTFQMNDPSVHVNADYASEKRNFDNMEVVIDERVASADDTKNLGISVGDYVCFDPRTVITPSGYIKSRFLDDKLSVVILLALAKHIRETKAQLKRKVYAYITAYEEVGHGCSASLPGDAVEIICVDMGCVGSAVSCTEHQVSICAKDSNGPSDYEVTTNLIKCAKEHNIDYAVDVYPYYGSDADAALSAGVDIRHSLIGSGVYASHGYERTHIDGVKNTFDLIKAYVLK